jgi:hypothetical protein
MNRVFRPGPGLLAACLALFLLWVMPMAAPLAAQSASSTWGDLAWGVRGSIIFLPQDAEMRADMRYDAMPRLPALGGALSYTLAGPLALEASLDLWGTDYGYLEDEGRPVPAIPDNRVAFVLVPSLAVQVLGRFDLTGDMTLRVFAGPAADLRLSLLSYNLDRNGTDPNTGRKYPEILRDMAAYFWGGGRWLLPAAGLGFDYRIARGVMLGLDARVWFPLYRLWAGESLSPAEGWRFSLGFMANFR